MLSFKTLFPHRIQGGKIYKITIVASTVVWKTKMMKILNYFCRILLSLKRSLSVQCAVDALFLSIYLRFVYLTIISALREERESTHVWSSQTHSHSLQYTCAQCERWLRVKLNISFSVYNDFSVLHIYSINCQQKISKVILNDYYYTIQWKVSNSVIIHPEIVLYVLNES